MFFYFLQHLGKYNSQYIFLCGLLIVTAMLFMQAEDLQAQDERRCRLISTITINNPAYEGDCIVSWTEGYSQGLGELEFDIVPDIGEIIQGDSGYHWRADITDGPMQFEVVVHLRDLDSAATDIWHFGTVIVASRPPQGHFYGPTEPVQIGEPITIGFTDVTDISVEDQTSGFEFAYDCNGDQQKEVDFTRDLTAYNGCQYPLTGIYTVIGYIRDRDGAEVDYRLEIEVESPPPPRQACTAPNPAEHITGTLDETTFIGTFTNASDSCAYEVGIASYLKFDEIIDNQHIFDYQSVRIAPGETLTLGVQVPTCAAQIDIFHGHVLMSLDGERYDSRLLVAIHTQAPYCTERDIPQNTESAEAISSLRTSPQSAPNCRINDSRVNDDNMRDCSPPIAIYCTLSSGIEIWAVNADTGDSVLRLHVTRSQIETVDRTPSQNTLIIEDDNLHLYRLTSGELQVNTWVYDPFAPGQSKPYVVTWDGC